MEQKLMRDQMWFHLSMLAMMKGAGRDDEAVAQAEKLQALIFSLPDDLFVQAELREVAS